MTAPALSKHDGHQVKREGKYEACCLRCFESFSLLVPMDRPEGAERVREPGGVTKKRRVEPFHVIKAVTG